MHNYISELSSSSYRYSLTDYHGAFYCGAADKFISQQKNQKMMYISRSLQNVNIAFHVKLTWKQFTFNIL